jgi:hypothetical protein
VQSFLWLPVTILSVTLDEGELDTLVGSAIPPLTFVLGYFLAGKWYSMSVRVVAMWMLLGAYFLGIWFLYIALMPSNGGFARINSIWELTWMLIQWWALYGTLMLAAGHGSLLGLVIATLFAIALGREAGPARRAMTFHR